ncbi:MAG TPA: redoxin domain-containing protein [Planctomycetota bacterium]|nr:redoxin domain-containing protein [Planctomycetota bacterium]
MKVSRIALALGALLAAAGTAAADDVRAEVGKPAPDFTLPDTDGKSVKLSSFRGRIVVLEWINPDCPVCKRVFTTGVVRKMLEEVKAASPDVVYLPISTTHYMTPDRIAAYLKENGIDAKGLMDTDGKVGRIYDARTTPHLYVIDAQGVLRYAGAIDDDPSGKKPGAENYVVKAVKAIVAGQKVSPETTKPYGCSVKYKG